jgi:hypothetical protein
MPLERGGKTKDVFTDEGMLFTDMYLSPSVIDGLTDGGFIAPSPIQAKCIPLGKVRVPLYILMLYMCVHIASALTSLV